MKRLLLFFLIIYLFTDFSLTQTIKSFKQLGYYGIKNKITGQILIKPKYKSIEQISDSMIVVVDTNNNYAIIDTLENILLPYSNYRTAFMDFDSINNGKFVEHPYRNDKGEISGYWYIVDKNRYCIPHDYYPCPYWKSLSNDTIPEYLSLIQKAIFYKSMNMIDSAILLCDEAINIEPTNPYVYVARALISIIDKRYKYIKNFKDVSEKEKNIITEYLEAAEKYENNSYYLVLINRIKYKWYKEIGNKLELHETENQIQKYNIETCRFGWFLLPTISYINGIETEIGLGRGYLIKETSFKRKCYQQGAIYYGASWIKNYTSNVDGYKIYLISFIKTLNAGIYPVLYTNYDQSELKLKLEAGLGYSYFGLNLGYNFHLKGYEFGKLNGWSLNFRAYIPLNKNKEFYKN